MSKTLITVIILTALAFLILVGAPFVHYYMPDAVPIYAMMYAVGTIGTIVLGTAIPFVCIDEDERRRKRNWYKY